MIVNHQYKFIFIRTRKVGGTSVEIALSKYCDSNDIISRMSTGDGGEVRRALGYQQHCNWVGFEAHETAQVVHKKLQNIWDSYFKFSIVRDPFEYIVSDYYWQTRNHEMPFDQFLEKSIATKNNNWYIHTIDDEPAMDYYVRYEHLTNDLNELSEILKLPDRLGDEVTKIHEKSEYRQNRTPEITEEMRIKIADAYKQEIDLYNKLKTR